MEIRRETAPANRQFRTKSGLPRPYKTKAPFQEKFSRPKDPKTSSSASASAGARGGNYGIVDENIGDGNDGIVDGNIGDVRSSLLLVHGPGGGRRSESDGVARNVGVVAKEKRVTRVGRRDEGEDARGACRSR